MTKEELAKLMFIAAWQSKSQVANTGLTTGQDFEDFWAGQPQFEKDAWIAAAFTAATAATLQDIEGVDY